jgi:hypothetical protein
MAAKSIILILPNKPINVFFWEWLRTVSRLGGVTQGGPDCIALRTQPKDDVFDRLFGAREMILRSKVLLQRLFGKTNKFVLFFERS